MFLRKLLLVDFPALSCCAWRRQVQHCRVVTAPGALPLCRCCPGLGQSAVDGGGAPTSPTTWGTAPSGSASALVVWLSLTRTACHRWYAPGGDDPCPHRKGSSWVSPVVSGWCSLAPLPLMRLSCNGLNMCIDARNVAGQGFFDNALRFDLVQPCDNSNICLLYTSDAADE